MLKNNKIIVILGPTASGKSDVAIKLAKKFNGEVISADSRQIYRGMDVGSGKVLKDKNSPANAYLSEGIVHHMFDIVNPMTDYSVAKFKRKSIKIIKDILSRGKLPIICGGTGFWIKAIVDDVTFPEVKPDFKLRNKLNKNSAEDLFKQLQKIDPTRAKSIDPFNKVRLIRSIEIAKELGQVPTNQKEGSYINWKFLQIGIAWPKEVLYERIDKRLENRFQEEDMINEILDLHNTKKVTWKRMEDFGLEYRWISKYVRGQLSLEQMKEKLASEIKKYAKRQMTWFKKDKRIIWLTNYNKIEKEVKNFLN